LNRIITSVNGEFELLGELGGCIITMGDGLRSSSSSSSNRGLDSTVGGITSF
jgi:hypothetical protein